MAGNADKIIVGAATFKVDTVDVGFTKGGTTVRYEPEWVEIEADQAVGIVARRRSSERMFITTTMLEVTLTRIQEAFSWPASNLSGSTLTLGYNDSCGGAVNRAIQLIVVGMGCGTRTFNFPQAIAIGNREYAMTRTEEVAFEVEFEALKDASGNFGTIVDSA